MDADSQIRTKLAALREQSTVVRQRVTSPQTHLETIALAAWNRADALAEAVERAATPPAVVPCCSILARVLLEDCITFAYIAKAPQTRIDQALASEIQQYIDMKNHPWLRGRIIKPLPTEARRFLRKREKAQRAAEAKAKEQYGEHGKHKIAVDDYACLPSFRKRLRAVGAEDVYAAYSLESRNGVHFSLMALLNKPDLNPSLFAAIALYRRILRAVTGALHLEDSIPPDPDEARLIARDAKGSDRPAEL